MKDWFKRHKIVLISLLITSIILFIITVLQINFITKPYVLEDLSVFIETNQITPALRKYVLITVINIIVFVIWILLFIFILWRIFFPTNKIMRDAFSINSLEFLYKMPNNLKKELKRDE